MKPAEEVIDHLHYRALTDEMIIQFLFLELSGFSEKKIANIGLNVQKLNPARVLNQVKQIHMRRKRCGFQNCHSGASTFFHALMGIKINLFSAFTILGNKFLPPVLLIDNNSFLPYRYASTTKPLQNSF